MSFRPMTEKEAKENAELITKFKKEIERLENMVASLESQKKEGVWVSGIDWNKNQGDRK